MDGQLMGQRLTEQEALRLWNIAVRFLRWAGATSAEDLASETLVRLLQNLENGVRILNLEAYVRQVAKNVLQEQRRQGRREFQLVEYQLAPTATCTDRAEELSQRLERCKKECLTRGELRLIEAYYGGNSGARRKKLAVKMNLSENALRLQAFRVRQKLKECLKRCQADRLGK